MNNALNRGFYVAQGFRDAKNPSDGWISGSYFLYYLLQNVFYNPSRMMINGSASLNGTGLMISKKVIDEIGFATKTLTEDMEFTAFCALNNERIAFVSEAITYDEFPNDFKQSWHQRRRWSTGIMDCLRLYSKKLLLHFCRTGNIAALDIFLVYLGPIVQILGLVLLGLSFIYRNNLVNKFILSIFKFGWVFILVIFIPSSSKIV